MAKFRKGGKKEVPQVSTSSLPDIVYMLIFFFMITTTMRKEQVMVGNDLPKAATVQKLEHKALVSSIYIGPAKQGKGVDKKDGGSNSSIQLDDKIINSYEMIPDWIQKERNSRNPADRNKLTTALKVDNSTRMGVVTEVKQQLRKSSALRISYTAKKVSKENEGKY